jgi:hypothetical protein
VRTLGRIPECLPQLIDRGVEAVVEVDECIRRPDLRAELFPSDDLPRSSQQYLQDKKRLFLQLDPRALLAKFARAQVDLKNPKAQQGGRPALKGRLFRISPPS